MRPLNFRFEKDDATKTGRFLLFFILVYLAATLLLDSFFPVRAQEEFIAGSVLAGLQATGSSGTVALNETVLIELQNGKSIEISELCTGRMELLIIVSAIIASLGIDWRKRLLGAAIAAVAAIAFNFARIFVAAILILGSSDIGLIEFTHNILFRIFLFFTIAVLYIGWFYWAVSAEAIGKAKRPAAKRKK
ncbi:MAG: archaeosortase/exosortase family protein [Candidatus Diapherotrites archaeon]|nr:archaeosortase/exosortase family protein [Candidatus Diapherotrites archaeon]